jgi:hypothetical protein
MNNPTALVQKLWNYCSILRDDGLSYGDYVEQLTLGSLAPARSGLRPSAPQNPFRPPPSGSSLKMADEQSRTPFNNVAEPSRLCFGGGIQRRDAAATIPKGMDWPALLAHSGRLASAEVSK